MNSSKWIRLSSQTIAPSVHPSDAIWSTESPSPYDVPSHARSSYDATTGCFSIYFKYFEIEALESVVLDEYFTAQVGKNTKKIWSIKFDVHSFNRDKKKIANAAINSVENTKSVSNGMIAARAIFSKGDTLLQAAFG